MELTATPGALLRERLPEIVTLAGDEGWDEARMSFNVLVDQQPAAVVRPRSVKEAAEAVAAVRDAGLQVAAQGSSHNVGLLGALDDVAIVRLEQMRAVEVDPGERSARIEAGARWWDVTPKTTEHGLAVMHGSSPEVNVVGYTLGGGLSWIARKYGMFVNSLTAIEVVTADGRIVRADAESEPDLFWALRGGGGSFGLVTAIECRLFPIDSFYAGALFFDFERSAEVLRAWREWLPATPEELMSCARLMQFPPLEPIPEPFRGRSFAIVELVYIGGETEGAELVAPLRSLGPAMDTVAAVGPDGLTGLHMDPQEPVPYFSDHALLGKLPARAFEDVVAVAGPGSGSPLLSVEFRQLGGALARVPDGAGALGSLEGEYAMFAVGAPMGPEMAEPVKASLAAVAGAVREWEVGRYFSFAENPTDLSAMFPPETLARLRAVKAAYDPDEVFRANHVIHPG